MLSPRRYGVLISTVAIALWLPSVVVVPSVEAFGTDPLWTDQGPPAAEDPSDVAVGNLRLLLTPDDDAHMSRFVPGTKVMYAVFDYSGADGHEIGLNVTGRGALNVFHYSHRYQGDGTESLEINGTDLTRSLTFELDDSAQAARDHTRRAATQPFGIQEYLLAAHGSLLRVGYALELLAGADVGPAGRALLIEVRMEANAADDILRDAIRVPMNEEERKRDLAEAADDALVQTTNLSGQLMRLVDRLTDLPLPETGPEPGYAYAVQLQVGGLPVAVKEFVVADSAPIYLPSCLKQ